LPTAVTRTTFGFPMSSSITRRHALKTIAGAATLASLGRVTAAEEKPATNPAPMSTTPNSGFQHSVCKWCYEKTSVDTRAKTGNDLALLEILATSAKEIGLSSVELLQPSEFPLLKKYGLTCAMVFNPTEKTPQGVTVGGIPKSWNRLEHHDTLVAAYEKRIGDVADAGFENLICFSGNREKMDDQQGLENCVVGLKRILPVAEKRRVNLMMELLNSKVNHKDYMCDRTPWGVELVKRLGSERFKLLYDIYHMQIMEGDVIRTIQENHQYIGHYHTAGNPGRNEFEPVDVQELNYAAIMRAIKGTGFKGFVGQEFIPKREPIASLRAAVQICSV
jgi:hydroxypyruvate isomerase